MIDILCCATCTKWRTSCKGVYRAPDWTGRDGGCGRWTDRPVLHGQTTLEAFA